MIDNISQVTLNFVAVVTCATPCLPLQLAYRSHEVARRLFGWACEFMTPNVRHNHGETANVRIITIYPASDPSGLCTTRLCRVLAW